jgi:chromosome partitioning protein
VRLPEGHPSIYEVLNDGLDVEKVIEPTNVNNLWLLPSSIDLAGAEIELVSALSREQQLRRALESTREHFDIVIVDCPPSLGLLTINALSAADGVLVPIQCEYYALEGLGALTRNAELVRQNLNPGLKITGFALTMYDGRTKLSHEVANEVRRHFGDLVFRTRIPRSVPSPSSIRAPAPRSHITGWPLRSGNASCSAKRRHGGHREPRGRPRPWARSADPNRDRRARWAANGPARQH